MLYLYSIILVLLSGSSAAWLARLVRDQEVAGSNPAFPTLLTYAEEAGAHSIFGDSAGGGVSVGCGAYSQFARPDRMG